MGRKRNLASYWHTRRSNFANRTVEYSYPGSGTVRSCCFGVEYESVKVDCKSSKRAPRHNSARTQCEWLTGYQPNETTEHESGQSGQINETRTSYSGGHLPIYVQYMELERQQGQR